MNRHLAPDVETVFLTPAATLQSVSSTLIREISQLGGDVAPYVSPQVLQALQAKKKA
jgi:pantetheine-phosphate adenylyltransferase